MRAFAALLVFGFHAHISVIRPLVDQGRLGVSFFFILSGMLLALVHRPTDTAWSFYRRRLARLYPAYLVAVLTGAVLFAVRDGVGPGFWRGLWTLPMLQSWWPNHSVYSAWDQVAWSLSTEMFFYLCFPLLIPVVARASVSTIAAIRLGCLAVIGCLGLWGALAVPQVYAPPDTAVTWAIYILPVGRLAEFVLGMTLIHAVRGAQVRVPKWAAVVLMILAYLAAALNPTGLGLAAITAVPICLLIVVFSQADSRGERSVLHHPLLVWAGQISYCFYLVHLLVIQFVGPHLSSLPVPSAAIELLIAGVAAWALHRLVEIPFDRSLNGRRAASVAAYS